MQLWTLLEKSIYEKIKKGDQFFSFKPENLHPIIHDWFIEKTGFSNWPVWCWLSTPSVELLQKYYHFHSQKNQDTILLELNIPNNEKMVFLQEPAWNHVSNYRFLDEQDSIDNFHHICKTLGLDYLNDIPLPNRELHNKLQHSWNKLFDLNWCENYFGKHDVRVCIRLVHPHWLESIYVLTPTTIQQAFTTLKY